MNDTPTTDAAEPAKTPARKSGGALGGKVLAELQEIAAGLGIGGAKKMRKGELIDAIKAARGDAPATAPAAAQATAPPASAPADEQQPAERPARSRAPRAAKSDDQQAPAQDQRATPQDREQGTDQDQPKRQGRNQDQGKNQDQGGQKPKEQGNQKPKEQGGQKSKDQGNQKPKDQGGQKSKDQGNQGGGPQQGGQNNGQNGGGPDDDDSAGGRRRNRRGRNRGNRGPDGEPTYTEDDVLVPAAGILDILDNYAFVRTTGYLPSENDVYVSLSMVRKWGLRKGDAVTGQVRQPREGERKEKFNPMVRVDTVNGMPLEEARSRVDFGALTPVYPDERLQLEHDHQDLTTRVIDVVAPVGKGQRGLIVAPPEAGVTLALRKIADAVTTNHPECHLMVVLVDERPEDVTELQRVVKGEVIASTFDRSASDHTTAAELSIERAKRLVELGHDVVVLLDSLTRLGRAYNQAAPAAARVTPGGVDPAALQPAKSFFGAGRNIEDGGSLTILAAVTADTHSRTDEAILEEFTGTATLELRLRRDLAAHRHEPGIDVQSSGTRREDQLLGEDELAVITGLREQLASMEPRAALDSVLERLRSTGTNAEALLAARRGR